jgi:hypothetical protein
MTIELNDLAYGNLNYDYINLLDADNEFTRLKESFLDFPYPQIDETKLEIENLISVQENAIKSKSWDKQYSFMQTADKNLDKLFISFYLKNELVLDKEFLTKLKLDISGLIMQLKEFYQRARPYQVAYYTEQNLVPFNSSSANTPSYPSGHSTQAYFIGLVESFKYPHKAKEIKKFCNMIAKSREVMGVHYESDTDFGKTIAIALSKHPTIIDLYFKK